MELKSSRNVEARDLQFVLWRQLRAPQMMPGFGGGGVDGETVGKAIDSSGSSSKEASREEV